ncbi:hypothetical protein [Belliella filtrata]|nr:hypothetical protein [Belliella filtrata]
MAYVKFKVKNKIKINQKLIENRYEPNTILELSDFLISTSWLRKYTSRKQ